MDMRLSPLRAVVIGVGAGIFDFHRPAIEQTHLELVAVSDVSPTTGEVRATELGVPFYIDHREMLQEVTADVAIILTPHPFHAEITLDCLKARCHVLVEKPIAVDIADADVMVETAKKLNKQLAVNFQQRFRPEIQAIHQLIHSQTFGAIQHVSLALSWTRTTSYYQSQTWRGTWKGEGGGLLMNQAPHDLDILCYLLGLPATVVAWTLTQHQPIETEDTVHGMLRWENSALGSIHISTAEAGPPLRLEIWGTKGYLQLIGDDLSAYQLETDVVEHIQTSIDFYKTLSSQAIPISLDDTIADHLTVYQHFYQTIVDDIPSMIEGASCKQSLELANAMLLSGATGETIQLPLDRDRYTQFLNQLRQ